MLPGSRERGAEAGRRGGTLCSSQRSQRTAAQLSPTPVPGLCPHCPRGLPTSLPPVPAWL